MRIMTIAQLRKNLSDCLEEAKNGEILIVTKYGKEICEIHPSTKTKLALFDSLTGIASSISISED